MQTAVFDYYWVSAIHINYGNTKPATTNINKTFSVFDCGFAGSLIFNTAISRIYTHNTYDINL